MKCDIRKKHYNLQKNIVVITSLYAVLEGSIIITFSCTSLMDQADLLNLQHSFWGELASVAFLHRPAQAARNRHLMVGHRLMVRQCRHVSCLVCSCTTGRCSVCKQPSI